MDTSVMPNFSPMSLQALSASLRDRKPLLSLSTMENTWHHHHQPLVPAGARPHLLDLLLVDVVRALRLPDPAVAPQLVHHILNIGCVIISSWIIVIITLSLNSSNSINLSPLSSRLLNISDTWNTTIRSSRVSTCLSKSSPQHQSWERGTNHI